MSIMLTTPQKNFIISQGTTFRIPFILNLIHCGELFSTFPNESGEVKVAQLCLSLCDPMDWSLPGFSGHGDSPGKITRVGCHTLLQGIFPTQGSNPGFPHCRWILYCLSHQRSPLSSILP